MIRTGNARFHNRLVGTNLYFMICHSIICTQIGHRRFPAGNAGADNRVACILILHATGYNLVQCVYHLIRIIDQACFIDLQLAFLHLVCFAARGCTDQAGHHT